MTVVINPGTRRIMMQPGYRTLSIPTPAGMQTVERNGEEKETLVQWCGNPLVVQWDFTPEPSLFDFEPVTHSRIFARLKNFFGW